MSWWFCKPLNEQQPSVSTEYIPISIVGKLVRLPIRISFNRSVSLGGFVNLQSSSCLSSSMNKLLSGKTTHFLQLLWSANFFYLSLFFIFVSEFVLTKFEMSAKATSLWGQDICSPDSGKIMDSITDAVSVKIIEDGRASRVAQLVARSISVYSC